MQSQIFIQWRALTIPKSSHKSEGNEDAFAPSVGEGEFVSDTFFQCAVADGATRSSFSRIFAKALVNICSTADKSMTLNDLIQDAREDWYQAIRNDPTHGVTNSVVNEGAYSTILWLQLFTEDSEDGLRHNMWKAQAIGDTCLFHYRNEVPLRILPIRNSSDFTNHPRLIGSMKSQVHSIAEWEFSGAWERGDDFFILTDSIAKWMLQEVEAGNCPGSILKEILSFKDASYKFELWVQNLRASNNIRDDDTTVVWMSIK